MSGSERSRGWFGAIVNAVDWMRTALVAVGGSLLLSGAVLVTAPEPSGTTGNFRLVALSLTGFGLFFGAFATAMAMVRLSRGLDRDRSALFLTPAIAGLLLLGVTVIQEVNLHLRIVHAPIGALSLVLLLGSIVTGGRALAPLTGILRLEPPPRWRGLALATIVSLGCGSLVSFLPLLLEQSTPRACALRIAGIAALSFAFPAFAALGPLRRFRQRVVDAADAADWCPSCGYRRPPGARCPECGGLDASLPSP